MMQIRLRAILFIGVICICLLGFSITALADDWQERDVLGFSDEDTQVLAFTTDNDGNVYLVYTINDPSGGILPLPMAKMYDGISWIELGSGYISEQNGGQFIVRYDETSEKLYFGLITINGVIHIYEFKDDKWEELANAGRLLRIDPQFIYYDFQVMSDGSLVVAYVDLLEDGRLTSKVYNDGKWIEYGEPGFTEDTASYISLAVDHNNQYVYAGVIIQRSEIEVWRYSADIGWEVTDNSGIESGYPYWVKMAIGNGDRPILIYMDTDLEWKTLGMIYDKGTWQYMDPHPFSPAMIRTFGMVMDSNGWPVVYFNDSENDNKVTSMKYNGEVWEDFGSRGFTQEGTTILFAGIDKSDVPFVLFPDTSNEGRIIKMEYGELEAESTTSSETTGENQVEENQTTALNNQADSEQTTETVRSQEKTDEGSSSIFVIVIVVLTVLFVIFIVIFLVLKRRKKDDED